MKVNYINWVQASAETVKLTFVGFEPRTGRHRRPTVELDSTDLAQIIAIAKSFRRDQRESAKAFNARAQSITNAGVTE